VRADRIRGPNRDDGAVGIDRMASRHVRVVAKEGAERMLGGFEERVTGEVE
jgi:hypothetical protein